LSNNLAEVSSLVSRMPGTFYRRSAQNDKALLLITAGCVATTGYTMEQWLTGSITFKDIILPEYWSHYKKVVRGGLNANQPYSVEFKMAKKDGTVLWVWEQGHGLYENGQLISVEGYITDITLQKEREVGLHQELLAKQQLLEEYRGVVDTSAIVSKTDAKGVITYVNEQFCNVAGYSSEELVGATHAIIRHPETPDSVFKELWQTIKSGKTWKGTLRNRTKAGHDYYVNSAISPIIDADGSIVEFISVRFDVTELVEKEQKIRKQTTDQLTSLPNRQQLLEDLDGIETGYLSLININDFKLVNEYHGYEVGDRLLCDMANLLYGLVHSDGVKLYRLAGDEFAVLQEAKKNIESFDQLCDGIVNKVASTNLNVMGTDFALSVTLGLSNGSADDLLLNADIALHNAKEQNCSIISYDVYSPLKRQIDNNITWLKRIREAIKEERIVVFAQPIIDATTPEISRYECLMRLQEGESFYSPYLFLEAAKNGRLYGDLTRIVFEKACQFFAERDDMFSINITASDILNPQTATFIFSCVSRCGVGERLIFELVETEAIEESELIIQFFDRVKRLGCSLAIDDFGTGYSNFEYLLKLDIDYIKIDGSLIRYIDRDTNSRIVAETVVDFARRLNVKTVAEFVHSPDVETEVRRIGVDYLQGFLLGEPVPLADL
jgi:PAS domain S-box-containing protein/diguanylate cyclase (GGDEF)-like protein